MARTIPERSKTFKLAGTLEIRRLGYGAMQLTGDGVWGEPRDRDGALRILKHAVELGVNFIDTADAYGPFVNEQVIADALHPYPEDLVIATKGGLVRPGPGIWNSDARPEHLKEALEGSLKRLKLERIDLYQLHRPDPEVPFEESLGALVDFQKRGLIRHIGLSNVSVAQLEQALKMANIVSVQNRYNLTDRGSEPVLEFCEQEGIGFIPWYPLATGKLGGTALEKLAAERGATPAQVALAWLLQHAEVMLPIPGTSSIEHLEENMAAEALQLSPEDVEALTSLGA